MSSEKKTPPENLESPARRRTWWPVLWKVSLVLLAWVAASIGVYLFWTRFMMPNEEIGFINRPIPRSVGRDLYRFADGVSMMRWVLLSGLCGLVVLIYIHAMWILLSTAVRRLVRLRRWLKRPKRAKARQATEDSEKANPRRQSKQRWTRVLRWTTLTLAAAGLLCYGYAWLIEPYWPEITRFQIYSDKLPAGNGHEFIRIVHFSDTHCDGDAARMELELPGLIRKLNPDLIFFNGDATNDCMSPMYCLTLHPELVREASRERYKGFPPVSITSGLPRFRGMMTQIAQIAPTYGVHGHGDGHTKPLEETGAVRLSTQPVNLDLREGSVKLCLIGGGNIVKTLQETASERFVILLNPKSDSILGVEKRQEQSVRRMPDLFLTTDDAHGGQICLPFYGAVTRRMKTYELFADGLVEYNGTWVHSSRGIGMRGNMPRIRFLCRPEIAVIDIYGTGPSTSTAPTSDQ